MDEVDEVVCRSGGSSNFGMVFVTLTPVGALIYSLIMNWFRPETVATTPTLTSIFAALMLTSVNFVCMLVAIILVLGVIFLSYFEKSEGAMFAAVFGAAILVIAWGLTLSWANNFAAQILAV